MTATAPVTYSPPAGTYGTPQTVTLSTETAGASIYYTVDGSDPTAEVVTSTSVVATSPSVSWGFTATAAHGIYFGEYKPGNVNGRIYKSIDGGNTWDLQTASPIARWRGVALSPSGVLFFGQKDGGVYKTTDGGLHFDATALPPAVGNYDALLCTVAGTLLAGQYGSSSTKSVYRSTDNGATYSTVLTGISSVCMGQDRNGGLYVTGENSSVYYSNDDGLTWSAIPGTTGWTMYTGTQKTSVQYPSASLSHPLYFAKEGGGVYEALDGQLTLFSAFGTATEWSAMSLARGGLLVAQYSSPGFTNAIKGQDGIGGTYPITWDGSALISIFESGDRLFLGKYSLSSQLVEAVFTQTYAGTLYTAPLTISESTTVKALAVKAGLDDSAVTSAAYIIGLSFLGALISGLERGYSVSIDRHVTVRETIGGGVRLIPRAPAESDVWTVDAEVMLSAEQAVAFEAAVGAYGNDSTGILNLPARGGASTFCGLAPAVAGADADTYIITAMRNPDSMGRHAVRVDLFAYRVQFDLIGSANAPIALTSTVPDWLPKKFATHALRDSSQWNVYASPSTGLPIHPAAKVKHGRGQGHTITLDALDDSQADHLVAWYRNSRSAPVTITIDRGIAGQGAVSVYLTDLSLARDVGLHWSGSLEVVEA